MREAAPVPGCSVLAISSVPASLSRAHVVLIPWVAIGVAMILIESVNALFTMPARDAGCEVRISRMAELRKVVS